MIYQTYKSADDCEAVAAYVHVHAADMIAEDEKAHPNNKETPATMRAEGECLKAGRCIATDDPRLAK
jgi:hypothetical protein